MNKTHYRQIINKTKYKLAAEVSKETNALLPENSG